AVETVAGAVPEDAVRAAAHGEDVSARLLLGYGGIRVRRDVERDAEERGVGRGHDYAAGVFADGHDAGALGLLPAGIGTHAPILQAAQAAAGADPDAAVGAFVERHAVVVDEAVLGGVHGPGA